MDILDLSLTQLVSQLSSRKLKPSEVASVYLDRAKELNPKLNAYIYLNDQVLDDAKKLDEAKPDSMGKLFGAPLALKDMFCTQAMPTTAASKILLDYRPPYSATVVNRLQQAGALVLGKCNQDEFAMGSSNESSYFGACKNPWDLERVPGGSSGGSAAAVSARIAPAALGTDTGGSIRQPASFCGLVGLKPTYGRVSRYGIIAFASSLDQAGPMTRKIDDAALLLEVMSGHDPFDATSSQQSVPNWSENLNSDLKGLKVGIVKEHSSANMQPDTVQAMENVKKILVARGASTVEVSLPYSDLAVSIYYIIATCEASSNLARYDGVRYGQRAKFENDPSNLAEFYSQTRGENFGSEVKRRIILGTYALSSGYYDAYYNKASQVRRLLQQSFKEAFKNCDVILSPVTNSTAFKLNEKVDKPLDMYLDDVYTTSANLAGLPGISVPVGSDAKGLPIGAQLLAPHFEEQALLNAGLALEEEIKFYERSPNEIR